MKVKVIKAYGNIKKGAELNNMHPSTAEALKSQGLIEVIEGETKDPKNEDMKSTDFNNSKNKRK